MRYEHMHRQKPFPVHISLCKNSPDAISLHHRTARYRYHEHKADIEILHDTSHRRQTVARCSAVRRHWRKFVRFAMHIPIRRNSLHHK